MHLQTLFCLFSISREVYHYLNSDKLLTRKSNNMRKSRRRAEQKASCCLVFGEAVISKCNFSDNLELTMRPLVLWKIQITVTWAILERILLGKCKRGFNNRVQLERTIFLFLNCTCRMSGAYVEYLFFVSTSYPRIS